MYLMRHHNLDLYPLVEIGLNLPPLPAILYKVTTEMFFFISLFFIRFQVITRIQK